jgi:signal transduction histidine kinase
MLACRGDAAALGHALWNLLDNAVKYSPPPHVVRVSVAQRGAEVSIAVADQGFGIPAREQQDVFRKFVRGSDTARRGIKGTGLGLAMVSHIAHAHGGSVEVESTEGEGSTFRLVLPRAQSPKPSVVSLKKSCTSVAVWVRCAHAENTSPQADVAD